MKSAIYSKFKDSVQEELDDNPIIKITQNSYVFEDGTRIAKEKYRESIFPKNFEDLSMTDYQKDPEFFDKYKDFPKAKTRVIRARFFESIEKMCREASNTVGNVISEDTVASKNLVQPDLNFDNFLLFTHGYEDRYAGSEVLYDTVNDRISTLSPDIYIRYQKAKGKHLDMNLAVFEYDPRNITPLRSTTREGYNLHLINTYIAPPWRKLPDEVPKTMPPMFAKFLKHLFPDIEDRRFVLCWVKRAIMSRNETVLLLNGAKGCGKNVFTDFLKELVGSDNFGSAKKSLFKKEFNSVMEDKRLILIDELSMTKDYHTVLKDICNPVQNIEKKGKDANNLTPTYFSIVTNNNDTSDIYLEYDDRRFNTPRLADKNLNLVFTEPELKELISLIEDPLAIKQIGEFIINYTNPKYEDPFYVVKNEKFHHLVKTSLKNWQSYLFERLEDSNGKPLNLTDLMEDAREVNITTMPSNKTKIEDFFRNYKHRGEYTLGSVEKIGRRNCIVINPEFKEYVERNSISIDEI